MRFPFCRNRDSVKNGILISIRRTGDGFHPGLFNKALFCDEVTLIKKKIGAEKAPVLNSSIHFRRWSPSVSRSVIAPRFSSTRPSSEKLLSIRATASRAELMC